jgi:hypothetical protein
MKNMASIWSALLRVFAGPLKHGEKKADGARTHVSESSQLFLGAYTTGEARRLLDRFTAQGGRFEIKGDVRGPTESDDGSYVDQPRISIFVDKADVQRATELITDVRREEI